LRRRVFSPENLAQLETPQTAQDVTRFIATTMTEVRMARLDPRIANALSQLGGVFLRGLELGDLERRVSELERKRNGGKPDEPENAS
jgi:hypothetical protein